MSSHAMVLPLFRRVRRCAEHTPMAPAKMASRGTKKRWSGSTYWKVHSGSFWSASSLCALTKNGRESASMPSRSKMIRSYGMGKPGAACVVRAALGMRSGARLAATARLAVAATTAAAGLVGGSSLATAGAAGAGAVCATAGKGVGGVHRVVLVGLGNGYGDSLRGAIVGIAPTRRLNLGANLCPPCLDAESRHAPTHACSRTPSRHRRHWPRGDVEWRQRVDRARHRPGAATQPPRHTD